MMIAAALAACNVPVEPACMQKQLDIWDYAPDLRACGWQA
jgi:hypothetical protein